MQWIWNWIYCTPLELCTGFRLNVSFCYDQGTNLCICFRVLFHRLGGVNAIYVLSVKQPWQVEKIQHMNTWWRHQMETFFRVTGPLCGEFTGPGEFPTQRPVTRSCDVFFDLRLNKRLSKEPWGWWFETLSWSLCRQCNELELIR